MGTFPAAGLGLSVLVRLPALGHSFGPALQKTKPGLRENDLLKVPEQGGSLQGCSSPRDQFVLTELARIHSCALFRDIKGMTGNTCVSWEERAE